MCLVLMRLILGEVFLFCLAIYSLMRNHPAGDHSLTPIYFNLQFSHDARKLPRLRNTIPSIP